MYKPRTNNPNGPVTLPIIFMEQPTEACEKEIFDTLRETPFAKISVPVTMPQVYLFENAPNNQFSVSNVGWVRRFNDNNNKTMQVNIFPNVRPVYDAMKNPAIEIRFKTKDDGTFITITKVTIVDLVDYTITEEVVEDEE